MVAKEGVQAAGGIAGRQRARAFMVMAKKRAPERGRAGFVALARADAAGARRGCAWRGVFMGRGRNGTGVVCVFANFVR